MKHIQLLALAILFLTSFSLRSQSWFEGNPQWVNYHILVFSGSDYEYVSVQGDTMVGGYPAKILKRVNSIWGNTVSLVRQNGDTIWCWDNIRDTFFVHYNFSLSVGDTVEVPYYWAAMGSRMYVIDSIGSINISGYNLRFQYVHYDVYKSLIIEKMGMVGGYYVQIDNDTIQLWEHFFLDEPYSIPVDGPGWFLCRFQNDQFTYHISDSKCNALVAAPEVSIGSSFTITPNPFQNDFTIHLPPGEKIASLRLFDISGKVVLQISAPAKTKIHAGDLPPGVYFLEVLTAAQKRYFSKLAH